MIEVTEEQDAELHGLAPSLAAAAWWLTPLSTCTTTTCSTPDLLSRAASPHRDFIKVMLRVNDIRRRECQNERPLPGYFMTLPG